MSHPPTLSDAVQWRLRHAIRQAQYSLLSRIPAQLDAPPKNALVALQLLTEHAYALLQIGNPKVPISLAALMRFIVDAPPSLDLISAKWFYTHAAMQKAFAQHSDILFLLTSQEDGTS